MKGFKINMLYYNHNFLIKNKNNLYFTMIFCKGFPEFNFLQNNLNRI